MRLAATLSSILLLAACASVPPVPLIVPEIPSGADPMRERIVQLQAIEYWEARGRLAVTAGDRSASVSIIWQQRGNFFDIYLVAPLGQGVLNLVGDDRQVVLSNAKGETVVAPNAETLLAERLGISVPFSSLRYWLLGMPSPLAGEPVVVLDELSRPKTIVQDNWQVSYPLYRPGEPVSLPEKVFVKSSDMSVRLVVERWDISGPNDASGPDMQPPAPIKDMSVVKPIDSSSSKKATNGK